MTALDFLIARKFRLNKFLLVVLLCMMAVADLLALSSLLVHFVISASSPMLSGGMCKLIMFTTHTAYTQSMWCWLFMSSLRYIATTRPLQYTTLWRIPCAAMIIICVGAVLENVWLLLSVESLDVIGRQGCTQPFNSFNRVHRVLDIFISFVLPTLLVLYMDCAVLFRRTKPKTSDPMLQIVINRPNSEKKRVFHRFMVVTVASLVLNLPENLLRFLAALGLFDKHNSVNASIMVQLSQAMFFAQFAFNAFYLTTFVYDKSVLSKTNSSRQLSLSFRQRLEESSHMIRERSNTISYRATTPTPGLNPLMAVRHHSSCCALDTHLSANNGVQKMWL